MTPLALFADVFRQTGEGLLRLLYPLFCLGCRAPVGTEQGPLCARCIRQIERADPYEAAAGLARLPAADVIQSCFALWVFDKGEALQRAHRALKYGNRPAYGLFFGRLMGEGLRQQPGFVTPELVVPTPLHRLRLYERGYNQSAMLAQGLALALQIPVDEQALMRTRSTHTQTKLSQQARWENVAGAFTVCAPERVCGRRVLLVDDILTTGATAAAAAQSLRQAGAAAVSLAVLALARRL